MKLHGFLQRQPDVCHLHRELRLGGDRRGLVGPVNVLTFTSLAVVTTLCSFPVIYVFTKSMLDVISMEIEEGAAILGASPRRQRCGGRSVNLSVSQTGLVHPIYGIHASTKEAVGAMT